MEQQIDRILRREATAAERLDGYHQIIKILQEEKEISPNLLRNVAAILNLTKQDISSEHIKVSQDSLYFLGVLLSQPTVVSSVKDEALKEILDDVCTVIKCTNEKAICTRALWCLMKQKVPSTLYVDKTMDIIQALEAASDTFNKSSVSVEIEAIKVLNRLLIDVPDTLALCSGLWARRLYLAALHPMNKVREAAMLALVTARPCFEKQQCDLLSKLILDLKDTLVPGMLKLFKDKQELHVLKLWNILLDILGKTLHQGATLINNLLAVVEKAFKSPVPEVKIAAFKCWQHLINNFGSELDVLANPKRLRLVMQPLKANNARAESIAIVKFNVWWHLAVSLDSRLPTNMEMVLYPLLQLCFGLTDAASGSLMTSPGSNGVNTSGASLKLNTSGSSGLGQTFPSINRLGCEALAQILGHGLTLTITCPTFTVGQLSHPVISPPSLFIRHSRMLILAVKEAIANLTNDKKDLHLQLYLWHALIAHIRNLAETENIKDISEAISTFLNVIEEFVKSNTPPAEVTLKLLEATTSLPQRLLTSSALNVSSASVMHGTPALFLATLLFSPHLLKLSSSHDRFLTVFQKLVSVGVMSTTSSLGFIHSLVKTLDTSTCHVEQSESLYQLWSTIVYPLLENIQKTQEVNEGDALEHDFSCLYVTLFYPIQHLLNKPLLQNSFKTLVRTWGDLYRLFASCAALVSNTDANTCCEEFCTMILDFLTPNELQSLLFLDNLSQLVMIMLLSVDFTHVSMTSATVEAGTSPSTWMKRKQKTLGNMTSLVDLINTLLNAVNAATKLALSESPDTAVENNLSLCFKIAGTILEMIRHVYSHMKSSFAIGPVTGKLALSVTCLLSIACMPEINKVQQGQLMTKLESMWSAVMSCIQLNFNGPYDSDFLAAVSPLLEETLVYPRRNIRVKARMLWHSTFAQTYDTLNCPESLKSVLRKILPSLVPGDAEEDDEALDELGASNSHEGDVPNVQEAELATSPTLLNVSFQLSANENVALPKAPALMELAEKSSKRMRVEDMHDDEFVKIVPDAKKRRVLTEHQKEILSTKSDVPALYNDLSQSQDISCIPSQFSEDTETQQITEHEEQVVQESQPDPCGLVTEEKMEVDAAAHTAAVVAVLPCDQNICQESSSGFEAMAQSNIDDSIIVVDNILSQIVEHEANGGIAFNKINSDSIEIIEQEAGDAPPSPLKTQTSLQNSSDEVSVDDARASVEIVDSSSAASCVEIVDNSEIVDLPAHEVIVVESETLSSVATSSLDELKEPGLVSDKKLLTQPVLEIKKLNDEDIVELRQNSIEDEEAEEKVECVEAEEALTSEDLCVPNSLVKYVGKRKLELDDSSASSPVRHMDMPNDENVIPNSQASEQCASDADVLPATYDDDTGVSQELADDFNEYDSVLENSSVACAAEEKVEDASQEEQAPVALPRRRGRPRKSDGEKLVKVEVIPDADGGRQLRSKARDTKELTEKALVHKKLRRILEVKDSSKATRTATCNKSTETDAYVTSKTARKSLPTYSAKEAMIIARSKRQVKKSIKALLAEESPDRFARRNRLSLPNEGAKHCQFKLYKTVTIQTDEVSPRKGTTEASKEVLNNLSEPVLIDNLQMPMSELEALNASPVPDSVSVDEEILPLIVADTVEITSKPEKNGSSASEIGSFMDISEEQHLQTQEFFPDQTVNCKPDEQQHFDINDAIEKEVVYVNDCNMDHDSNSSVETEPCIVYSAHEEKSDDFNNDEEMHADMYEIPVSDDIEVTISQQDNVEVGMETTEIATSSVLLADDGLMGKEQVIYVVSDMPGTVDDNGGVASNVLLNSGMDLEMVKDDDFVNVSESMANIITGESVCEVEVSSAHAALTKIDEGIEHDEPYLPGGLKLKGKVKRRSFNKKFIELQMRAEDESLTFVAQRNTKTYSRESAIKARTFISKHENDALLGTKSKSRLVDKINSRAGRMLEAAAKKNLNSYEKMKYEQRRSTERMEGHEKLGPSEEGSDVDGTADCLDPESFGQNPVCERTLLSPSSSPTCGILKRRKMEVVASVASPTYRQRRVSFADPLVQDQEDFASFEVLEKTSEALMSNGLEMTGIDVVIPSDDAAAQEIVTIQDNQREIGVDDVSNISQIVECSVVSDQDANVTEGSLNLPDGSSAMLQSIHIVNALTEAMFEASDRKDVDMGSEVITVELYSDMPNSVTTSAASEIHQMEIPFEEQHVQKDVDEVMATEIPCMNNEMTINSTVDVTTNDMHVEECTLMEDEPKMENEEMICHAENIVEQSYQLAANDVIHDENLQVAQLDLDFPLAAPENEAVALAHLLTADEQNTISTTGKIGGKEELAMTPVYITLQSEVVTDEVSTTTENLLIPSTQVPTISDISEALGAEVIEAVSAAEDTGKTDPEELLQLADTFYTRFTVDNLRQCSGASILQLQKQLCEMTMVVASTLVSFSSGAAQDTDFNPQ